MQTETEERSFFSIRIKQNFFRSEEFSFSVLFLKLRILGTSCSKICNLAAIA